MRATDFLNEFGSILSETNQRAGDEEIIKAIEGLLSLLVDQPSKVKVDLFGTGKPSIIEIRVDRNDLGKITGKKGQTAQLIKSVVNEIGKKQLRDLVVEFIENDSPEINQSYF